MVFRRAFLAAMVLTGLAFGLGALFGGTAMVPMVAVAQ